MKSCFLKLSDALTGFSGLSANTAETYYQIITGLYPNTNELLQAYQDEVLGKPGNPEDLIRLHIYQNAGYQMICQKIILLWYNSLVTDDTGKVLWQAPPELYFDSLIWKVIDAHPPAISGGYFGYWRYAPEN